MCWHPNSADQELEPTIGELREFSKLCRHARRSNYLVRWSGRRDSNSRPPAPHAGTLPGCATPRRLESITEACTDSGTEAQVPDQRKISMTFFSSCLSAETLTPRASAARADAPQGVAERADAALRLSSRRLRAPLMVKPCSYSSSRMRRISSTSWC